MLGLEMCVERFSVLTGLMPYDSQTVISILLMSLGWKVTVVILTRDHGISQLHGGWTIFNN